MPTPEPCEYQAHPRLFWSESELGELRAKANHPVMAALRDDVLARCEHYVDPAHPAFIDNTLNRTDWVGAVPHCGHNWQKLPDLILAALLTDDARWEDTLASALRILTRDSSPFKAYIFAHEPRTGHDASLLGGPQRGLSSQCGMVPLMLDLLWDRLPDADRKAACDFLARDIVEPFLDYMLATGKDAGFVQNLGINTGW